jgi:predicted TIM-barrel fold metal-dependent hydrolase
MMNRRAAGDEAEPAESQSAEVWIAPCSSGRERPRVKVPPDATDCHHHIYDSQFPNDPTAKVIATDAKVADYRLLQRRLGTTRNVIVQPSAYGVDNRLLLESLGAFGLQNTRGVAVLNDSVSDAELKRLHAAGVRGIRFNMKQAGAATWEMIEPLSNRVAELGWHIQVNAFPQDIVDKNDLWNRVPAQVVFDHLANVPAVGMEHRLFGIVIDLLQTRKAWVKLSGAYIESKVGPPTYADSSAAAMAFVKEASERLVWGSDWPHPTLRADAKPDDALLLDLLAEWAPQEVRNRILVDNPAKLYDF